MVVAMPVADWRGRRSKTVLIYFITLKDNISTSQWLYMLLWHIKYNFNGFAAACFAETNNTQWLRQTPRDKGSFPVLK